MAPTIVLMQTDAFRNGLKLIADDINFLIDYFGLREYLPIIGLILSVMAIRKILRILMSSFER